MSKLFLPSCKVKANFKSESEKLRQYLEEKYCVETVGCCKVFCQKVKPTDTAIVICNNCSAIMEESSPINAIDFVWEIIDQDTDFPFPDYGGEAMTIQDCWRAYEKRSVQDAIRSIMRKMNIEVVELQENYENTRFCGADLLEPCTDIEKKFAPRRYVLEGSDMYHPMPAEEQDRYLKEHCSKITTEKVICYCMACYSGLKRGGAHPLHLIELLFPEPAN